MTEIRLVRDSDMQISLGFSFVLCQDENFARALYDALPEIPNLSFDPLTDTPSCGGIGKLVSLNVDTQALVFFANTPTDDYWDNSAYFSRYNAGGFFKKHLFPLPHPSIMLQS